MSPPPLVIAEHLSRTFNLSKPWLDRLAGGAPRRILMAVADVSFTIAHGETLALVGESGSGKTTVAKLTVGLLPATSGDVLIEGVSMNDPRQSAERHRVRRRIQMVFQDPYSSLNPRWRARDIVAEPIRAFGLAATRREIGDRVNELLVQVGLEAGDGDKYPHEFSGGQRQRIAIARAIASTPTFIVCDEPTSNLDVSVQAQVLNLMRDLQDKFGLTYLFISHNLAVVRHMAGLIGVMYLGRLVELAPVDTLFCTPRHPYTRMLLDAAPDVDMTGRLRKSVTGEIANPLNRPSGCAFHPRCPFAEGRCRREMPELHYAEGAMVACHAVEDGRT
jgi:peptide/nickel transport system ATP-binding protein